MIATLSGTLAAVLTDGAVVDVGGIGYRVHLTSTAVSTLPSLGTTIVFHTHLHVREDALTLFGFATADERDLFEILIGVNGIGPKNALAVLGSHTPDGLRKSVVTEDLETLTAVPGIGKKTAGRLILELKEKLALPDLGAPAGSGSRARAAEVREALTQLGYSAAEARETLAAIPLDEDRPVEELVRLALTRLARTASAR